MKKFVMIAAIVAVTAWAGTADAALGVSLLYDGSFYPGVGINFQPNGWVIDVVGDFQSIDGAGTFFGAIVNLDKIADPTADVSGLWGVTGNVGIASPDVGDGRTDLGAGVFIGGNAHLGSENFHLTGHCGVRVDLIGSQGPFDSRTDFGTFANLVFRWTGIMGGQ
jgi:hypothetical protein